MNLINSIFSKFAEPGHFYSSIPNLEEIEKDQDRIFNRPIESVPGIKISKDFHRTFFKDAGHRSSNMPFSASKVDEMRYYYKNPFFSSGDSIITYSMVRRSAPS